jgi:hypothetical protein
VQAVKPSGSQAAAASRSQLAALTTQPDQVGASKKEASRSSLSVNANQNGARARQNAEESQENGENALG